MHCLPHHLRIPIQSSTKFIAGLPLLIGSAFFGSGLSEAQIQHVVPGEANIWLSGMPVGTTASPGAVGGPDVSPNQSPTLALGLNVPSQQKIRFLVAGAVTKGDTQISHPDGISLTNHLAGTENGICGLTAPFQCLIGVFLGPDRPDASPAATPLSFSTSESRNIPEYSPELKQPFYIGDGRTSLGEFQNFTVPQGATRLFLGSNDSYGWSNNRGIFLVNILTTETSEADSISVSMCPSVNVTGQIGQTYRIEASTNLGEWEFLSRFVLAGNPSVFYDQQPLPPPKRFYRLVRE